MDTQTLIAALRDFTPEALEWKFGLYGTHKSRDGLELDWNLCKMKGIAGFCDTIRTAMLEKTVADKSVADWTPFLSDKENIGALAKTDELIRDRISDIILNIENGQTCAPEDFTTGAMGKVSGCGFYGEAKDEAGQIQQVLFMRRGSPFVSGQKALLCSTELDEIVPDEKPMLKFAPTADFLLIGGICYFISSAIGKDFELEERHFAIAKERLALIADAGVLGDHEQFEKAAMKSANARKFMDFDRDILGHVARLSIADRTEFLLTYGITLDNNGKMDTSDPEQCGLIIDLLCCRSFVDPLGRLSTGSNIMQRE